MNPRSRRLSLRKTTLQNLTPEAASNVRGGATVTCKCIILPATEDIDCATMICTVSCIETLCAISCACSVAIC
jgi:hypothetical protein